MKNEFNDKIVWITGASSGIGEALSYAFSLRGAKLILSGRRMEELERVKNACKTPEQIKIISLDLADVPSLENKTTEAISRKQNQTLTLLQQMVSEKGGEKKN